MAGLAAGAEILGKVHFMPASYSNSVGFDAISVALLGRSHPIGILFAALRGVNSGHSVPLLVAFGAWAVAQIGIMIPITPQEEPVAKAVKAARVKMATATRAEIFSISFS